MAFDLAFDLRTRDLVFGSNRDLMGVSGDQHITQRIFTRLKISKGSWVYDVDGDLGSRVHLVFRYPPDRIMKELPAYVREALAPMQDITISNVEVVPDEIDDTMLHLHITWEPLPIDGATTIDPQQLSFPIVLV